MNEARYKVLNHPGMGKQFGIAEIVGVHGVSNVLETGEFGLTLSLKREVWARSYAISFTLPGTMSSGSPQIGGLNQA
ncbi:MAG: hypothetical protein HQL77_17210 [Magnetococcales bacterium]|nr:hypothetical protein [Magnetococcales bacterium]